MRNALTIVDAAANSNQDECWPGDGPAHDDHCGISDHELASAAVKATEGLSWEFSSWSRTADWFRSTLEENATVGTDSTDEELMACYESNRRNGNGEAIGEVSQSPSEAVKSEGWTLVRAILKGTNCPGTPVLAKDAADRIWVVNDLDGPWAIQVAEND